MTVTELGAPPASLSEEQLAEHVDLIAADPQRCNELVALLREDHAFYDQRGAAAVVRLRGWVLLAVARVGVTDDSLIFVLDELDNGLDPYLVAAAAHALRSYRTPAPALAPFVARALNNILGRDEPVSFAAYGEYAVASNATSPIRELLDTLCWLGPAARSVAAEVAAIRNQAFPRKLLPQLDLTIRTISAGEDACCDLPAGLRSVFSWARESLRRNEPVVFEDHNGQRVAFDEVFHGHPSIVVFFYTRCDNPLKCSLTITKLGRVQKLLEERGLAGRIHTAAITYDPAFDLPARFRAYGERRGLQLDSSNRMLRATEGMTALRGRFKLGVNFVESLVNRHRIEAYVLDANGRIAFSFERLLWAEQQMVERAVELLAETDQRDLGGRSEGVQAAPHVAAPMGTLASVALAFFPKCPVCWAAYLSVFGIAGLQQIPYTPWIQALLALAILVNVTSVWLRARSTQQRAGAWLVTAGAGLIVLARLGLPVSIWGVAATAAGSVISVLQPRTTPRRANPA